MKFREVIPLKQSLDFFLTLPGSKSITNRAFLCAALAKGKSGLYGALESDDTVVMLKALRQLKIKSYTSTVLSTGELRNGIGIEGCGGRFEKGDFMFDLHNAGTATRFLTAVMAIREGTTTITGDRRMQERPIKDLVEGLRQIGVQVEYLNKTGYPPLKIIRTKDYGPAYRTGRLRTKLAVQMKGDKSSQYFSALLMLGPLLPKPLKIEVIGELVSKPYIDTTIEVMKAFGVKVKNNNYRSFEIKPQTYKACDYWIEGDASASSYWISMAYLHDGKVGFSNLLTPSLSKKLVHKENLALNSVKTEKLNKKSIQGDERYGFILKNLKNLNSKLEIDMEDMPDVAMTLACTVPFIKGQIKITGLSTLRIKETDRLAALEKELGKIGVKVKTTNDTLRTEGWIGQSSLQGKGKVLINTYNDHRMAMCFAVVGTKIPGIRIENPGCTDKTYPEFWEDLERMYLSKPIKLGNKNLVLTGMRCSGKTRHGKKIAKLLKRPFVDLDHETEKVAGLSINQIVEQKSWDHFRKLESRVCQEFADQSGLVIATGGGVVMDEENMKNLKKNGVNVFIFADPNVLAERVEKHSNTRPSLTGEGAISEIHDIWQERRDLYLRYADYVWDNTTGKVVGDSLERVFS